MRIEDYALIGDCNTAALVSRDGSIDWLCFPAFDSRACFAKLVGHEDNGFWRLAPSTSFKVDRAYEEDTLILTTDYSTSSGSVRVTDFMDVESADPRVIRKIEGVEGEVSMASELVLRFDYGSIVPWVTRQDENTLMAVAGPDAVLFSSSFPTRGENLRTKSEFVVRDGETHIATLTYYESHRTPDQPKFELAKPAAFSQVVQTTEAFWRSWIKSCSYEGPYANVVRRSLLTLKALTFRPTGGIVAAPTSSLPEELGGERNWDYRYCWLRDATFTLYSFLTTGFTSEADQWRRWLVRAVAGTPSQVNILYGLRGERRVPEAELPWLDGYESSKPVRTGNAAYSQRQLDIFGELLDTLQLARTSGLGNFEAAWDLQREMIEFVAATWREPDHGIWEIRGDKQHFTHSKAMAWVAMDRGVKAVERFKLDGDVDRWRTVRDEIRREILEHGYNTEVGAFTQYFGSKDLDASVIQLAVLGFLPANDPRMQSTIQNIESELMENGLLKRYRTENKVDGLKGSEGRFLACTFWLVDYHVLAGNYEKAKRLFEQLLALPNDVGLLSEEYDPQLRRQLGNFPQALSHIALINSAVNLSRQKGSAHHRSES